MSVASDPDEATALEILRRLATSDDVYFSVCRVDNVEPHRPHDFTIDGYIDINGVEAALLERLRAQRA